MQNLKEGDSVAVDCDSFDINGKIGTIRDVNEAANRCAVIIEGGIYYLSLDQVYKRSFLTE